MSIVFDIDLTNREIVIIGAGPVALRKAKHFLKEGANITVIAPNMHPEFQTLEVICKQRSYLSQDIETAFLVVAATNDNVCNQKIIEDAKQRNCLTMCVHHDIKTNAHIMVNQKEQAYHVAVSTNGTYPMASPYLLRQLTSFIKQHERKRFMLLADIRLMIMKHNINIVKHDMQSLLTYDTALLQMIKDSLQQGELYLLVYHGSNDEKNNEVLQQFHQRLRIKMQSIPIAYAYLSSSILKTLNDRQIQVFDYHLILPILAHLNIRVVVMPMLLQKGYFYHQILKTAQQNQMQVSSIPFDFELLKSYITYQYELYQFLYDEIIFTYHVNDKANTVFHELEVLVSDTLQIVCEDQLFILIDHNKKQYIIPLYVLYGHHMEQLSSCSNEHVHSKCLLDNPIFYNLLIQKLM